MATFEVSTRITHRYLMRKSKDELASWLLRELDRSAALCAENERLTDELRLVTSPAESVGGVIAEARRQLDEKKQAQETLACRVLGKEKYDNSPCQAHPLELVEHEFIVLRARVQELEYELRKLPVISAAVESLHKQRDEMARIAGKALRELIDICGRSGGGAALAGTEKPGALAEKGESDAD